MLDLEISVKDRETGVITEKFVQLSVTARELGNVHKLIHAIHEGLDIDIDYQEQ